MTSCRVAEARADLPCLRHLHRSTLSPRLKAGGTGISPLTRLKNSEEATTQNLRPVDLEDLLMSRDARSKRLPERPYAVIIVAAASAAMSLVSDNPEHRLLLFVLTCLCLLAWFCWPWLSHKQFN